MAPHDSGCGHEGVKYFTNSFFIAPENSLDWKNEGKKKIIKPEQKNIRTQIIGFVSLMYTYTKMLAGF